MFRTEGPAAAMVERDEEHDRGRADCGGLEYSSDGSVDGGDSHATCPVNWREARAVDAGIRRPAEQTAASISFSSIARRLGTGVAVIALVLVMSPVSLLPLLGAVLALPFLAIAVLRAAALVEIIGTGRRWDREPPTDKLPRPRPEELPTYAVLVPLYDEVEVIDQLVAALAALDYPEDLLEISLIVEAGDRPTRAVLQRKALPAHFRIVVVPAGQPRTKPRALNHALLTARGAYVTVFDAEDLPQPDQLLKAQAVLREGEGRTGCVQARLEIYNTECAWLSRQFTIEYASLFGALLPAFQRYRLPIPLGGTSNHFPRTALERAGGWDAYNVTEDADLGIRLTRLGYDIRMLDSATFEEAPRVWRDWLGQRTRWLKGWMQTYLVHMQSPVQLLRDLGLYRFLGLQLLMGAMILSPIVHPWVYAVLITGFASGEFTPDGLAGPWTWFLYAFGAVNLIAGFATAMALGAVAAPSSSPGLKWHVAGMPVYWVLISIAAYRALWQLAKAPFEWEKTPHHGREKVTNSGPFEDGRGGDRRSVSDGDCRSDRREADLNADPYAGS